MCKENKNILTYHIKAIKLGKPNAFTPFQVAVRSNLRYSDEVNNDSGVHPQTVTSVIRRVGRCELSISRFKECGPRVLVLGPHFVAFHVGGPR